MTHVATEDVCTVPDTEGSLVIGRAQYGGNEVDHLLRGGRGARGGLIPVRASLGMTTAVSHLTG